MLLGLIHKPFDSFDIYQVSLDVFRRCSPRWHTGLDGCATKCSSSMDRALIVSAAHNQSEDGVQPSD